MAMMTISLHVVVAVVVVVVVVVVWLLCCSCNIMRLVKHETVSKVR